MNTIITLTLKDVLLSGVYIGLIALIIYAIKILIKAHSSIKSINKIINDNKDNIDKILNETPGISKNINNISEEIAHDIGRFRGTVDNIADTSESITGVIKDNNTIANKLTSVLQTGTSIKKSYDHLFNNDSTPKNDNKDI